eukprot:819512-Prymnesium_polylepis.1
MSAVSWTRAAWRNWTALHASGRCRRYCSRRQDRRADGQRHRAPTASWLLLFLLWRDLWATSRSALDKRGISTRVPSGPVNSYTIQIKSASRRARFDCCRLCIA